MREASKPTNRRKSPVFAQWYSKMPRQGAIYFPRGWSIHWAVSDKPWPRRQITVYRGTLWEVLELTLWRHKDFCPHGYYKPTGAVRLCHLCAEFTEEYFEEQVGLR